MTPKNKQRAMSRRARQNKSPTKSDLTKRPTGSSTWNLYAQSWPGFNNTLRKDNQVHRFIQTTDLGVVVTTSNTLPVFYGRSFTFNDVNQNSSFAAIFDQYRIDEIEIWVVPGMLATTTAQRESYYSVVDYDDANVPTGLGQLQQYTNVIMTPMSNGHYVRFKPHIAVASYSGAFTSFKNEKADWMDVASPSIQHYGFKAGFNTTSAALGVQLVIRLHFSLRNTI